MTVFLWALALAASLALLVWAADRFIAAAERIGLAWGLSPFVLGVSVVAVGTSLPELLSSVVAVLRGAPELAIGTVVGSNVANLLLILGAAAALGRGLRVDSELVRVDLPFLFGSALLLWLVASDGAVDRLEALICVAALAVYVGYAAADPESPTTVSQSAAEIGASGETPGTGPGVWLALVGAAALTQLGAYGTIESAIRIASTLAVGGEVVAATVVAFGTSLPELVVSVQSARQGKPEIAVGNVIGSNVFNALGVTGGAALFGSLAVPASMLAFGLPAMLGVTVLAFFVLQEREMTRWDARLLIALYVAFVLQIVRLA